MAVRPAGNGGFAVNDTSVIAMTACCNWWGDPGGTGAALAGNVSLCSFSGSPGSCVSACPVGDASGDGATDSIDLNIVLANFGQAVRGGADDGDFETDGAVTSIDLNIVLATFGDVCD